jgi:hypothetical protein
VTAQQVATSVGAAVFVALDGSKIDPHPSMDLSFRRLPDGYLPNYTGVVQTTR